MKSRHEIHNLSQAFQKKIFTTSFFRTVERVVRFNKDALYLIHDRYTIKDLGERNGRKWIQLSNCNACTPFHSFVIGLKTELPVKSWWKETNYQMQLGTDENPNFFDTTYYPDMANPLVIRYVFGSGDELEQKVEEAVNKADCENLLNYNYKGWWFDNPDWIDRFAALGILTELLEVFNDWKKIED